MTNLQAAFDLLGVSPESDATTVKKAWRSLVRSYHPDMAKTDPQAANRRLAEINAAFDAVRASGRAERSRQRAEAAQRARERIEAAERARLEALAIREKAQQAAARAALTEPETRPARRGTPAAGPVAGQARPAETGAARPAAAPASDDRHALGYLARRAAAAFQAVQMVCAKERKTEPRSVYR